MFGRSGLAALVAACCLTVGCGGDDKATVGGSSTTPDTAARTDASLAPVKDYLVEHSARLKQDTATLREDAEAYYELAEGANFDYAKLLSAKRAEVKQIIEKGQADFRAANPSYEEMEGIVAGVPSLADFDVQIDAGADGSDPENAVSFDVLTPGGKTYKQPGNYFYLLETAFFGTDPKFAAKGVEPDLDGDGTVSFGESVPDADFLVAAARDFEKKAAELDTKAQAFRPTRQDAFNALVVMTPTMSEYFEAWKNSRFVSGAKATENAFVASSRLQDIADILGGLEVIYGSVKPEIAKVDAAQADQSGAALTDLRKFATDLLEQEKAGKKYTAQEADTLGSEAQERAESIAGQVSQAAGQLGIELET